MERLCPRRCAPQQTAQVAKVEGDLIGPDHLERHELHPLALGQHVTAAIGTTPVADATARLLAAAAARHRRALRLSAEYRAATLHSTSPAHASQCFEENFARGETHYNSLHYARHD